MTSHWGGVRPPPASLRHQQPAPAARPNAVGMTAPPSRPPPVPFALRPDPLLVILVSDWRSAEDESSHLLDRSWGGECFSFLSELVYLVRSRLVVHVRDEVAEDWRGEDGVQLWWKATVKGGACLGEMQRMHEGVKLLSSTVCSTKSNQRAIGANRMESSAPCAEKRKV